MSWRNTQLNDIRLIIFDVDGTISKYKDTDGKLYAAADDFFFQLRAVRRKPYIALASNQGEVGLRYWMETGEFGEPDKYPTERVTLDRIDKIAIRIEELAETDVKVYVCLIYLSKSGNWSPARFNTFEWNKANRKPNPGMLNTAMVDAGVLPEHTLMIGDKEEDEQAAKRAGCHFQYVNEFLFDSVDPAKIFRRKL